MKSEITSETIKAAPPVGLMALAHFSNWTLNDVVLALTGVYVLAQLAYLFWKWRREAKKHGRK